MENESRWNARRMQNVAAPFYSVQKTQNIKAYEWIASQFQRNKTNNPRQTNQLQHYFYWGTSIFRLKVFHHELWNIIQNTWNTPVLYFIQKVSFCSQQAVTLHYSDWLSLLWHWLCNTIKQTHKHTYTHIHFINTTLLHWQVNMKHREMYVAQ